MHCRSSEGILHLQELVLDHITCFEAKNERDERVNWFLQFCCNFRGVGGVGCYFLGLDFACAVCFGLVSLRVLKVIDVVLLCFSSFWRRVGS